MTEAPEAAQLERTRALLQLGRHQDALREVARYLAADPQSAQALCLQAQALLGTGDPDRALLSARGAAASDPALEWPHRLASIALQRLGRAPEAVLEAERAVQAEPFVALARVQLAQARLALGDLPTARRAAEEALGLGPHLVGAHLAAGAVAAAEGRVADAEAAFREALRLDPQSAAAHNELARLQLRRRRGTLSPSRLAAAASGFGDAVRADPTAQVSRRNVDVVLHTALGWVSYLLVIAAWIGHGIAQGAGVARGALWVPLGLALLPLAFAAVFVTRLAPALRRHLVRSLRRPLTGLPVAGCAVAVVLLALGGAVPATAHPAFDSAAVLAIGVRIALWLHGRRQGYVRSRRRRPSQ